MSLITPDPSPVVSSFAASSYATATAMATGRNAGHGVGLCTTTAAVVSPNGRSAPPPVAAAIPPIPVSFPSSSYFPQRPPVPLAQNQGHGQQPRGLGRQGGLQLQIQSLGLGLHHHHQQQQNSNKLIGPAGSPHTKTTTGSTGTPSLSALSLLTPLASSTRSEFEISTAFSPPAPLHRPLTRTESFNRLPAYGSGSGSNGQTARGHDATTFSKLHHEDDGENDDTNIRRLLFDILRDDGEDERMSSVDVAVPPRAMAMTNSGNRSRSLTVSSSSSLGPIINSFPVPPHPPPLSHHTFSAARRLPPPPFLLSPPCSPTVKTQVLPRNAILQDGSHVKLPLLDGLARPPPPLPSPPPQLHSSSSQNYISFAPPASHHPLHLPPAAGMGGANDAFSTASIPPLKPTFPSSSTPGSTSQCILTPDGKALARDYGPWVTVDVSPTPTINSVIMSWPREFPLPA